MKLPIHRHFNKHRKTSLLFFDDKEQRESYIKGGVCFPMRYKTQQGFDNKGYIVLGGMDVKTRNIHIYDQMSWVTVDDILATQDNVQPINAVKYPGVSHWLNRMWTEYFGQVFYFNQPDELSRRHRLQILRSPMINPKPRIVEIPVTTDDDFLSGVWHWVKSEALFIDKTSELFKDLETQMVDDQYMPPSIHALGCCLLGFERYPWRQPRERPIQEILIASDNRG